MKIISNCPQRQPLKWITLLGLLFCINGCSQTKEYSIGFLNKTGHKLDEVAVYSNGKLWGLPTPLVVGGAATEGGVTMPIPLKAEVRINDRGEHKSVVVNIGEIPKGFGDGTIYFVFNRDGTVQAKALKEEDTAGYVELTKGLRPEGEYRLGFVNRTGHDLKAVAVYYGDQKAGSGDNILGRAGANFTYSDPLLPPIPVEAEVRWDENGVSHAVKVRLENVPKGFDGHIFFTIKADGTVEIRPIKRGDDKASFEVVK